ncbi:hypothetical protein Droror1_Dr00002412, partial [Drosera rotundifolia]
VEGDVEMVEAEEPAKGDEYDDDVDDEQQDDQMDNDARDDELYHDDIEPLAESSRQGASRWHRYY